MEFEEDDWRQVPRPKRLPKFDMSDLSALLGKVPVVTLQCGGMHCAAITQTGAVFTWGCNDEGALGRSGMEDKPL